MITYHAFKVETLQTINWRRGFFRLYVVFAALWLGLCVLFAAGSAWTFSGILFALAVPGALLLAFGVGTWALKGFTNASTQTDTTSKSWRDRIATIELTRTKACLLSLFGPAGFVLVSLVVGFAVGEFIEFASGGKTPSWLDIPIGIALTVGFIAVVAGSLAIRLYSARWYVVDKGRDPNWGAVAIFGFWGWIVLWSLADLGVSLPELQGVSTASEV
ncbi:MAG: hypothetical protein ABI718_14610 [Acidobacteriota bacterium]